MFDKKSFRTAVREWRKGKDMPLRDAAIKLKVSQSTISKVENHQVPHIETFAKICKGIGVDAGKFFK